MIRLYPVAWSIAALPGCEKLEKQFAKPNLALQQQCAKQAQLEFTSDGFGIERTVRYSFTDHYNSALNKCFIEEFVDNEPLDRRARYSSIFVSDVYEHRKYASFAAPLDKGGVPLDWDSP